MTSSPVSSTCWSRAQPVADPGPSLFAVPDSGRRAFRDNPAAADHCDAVGQPSNAKVSHVPMLMPEIRARLEP